ncbi:MAG TPA: NAD(P)H-quinone oxidoreductase [Vicinamibacterales bacterium]
MKAIEIAAAGGPDVLRIANRPVPAPRDGEVLVRVAAAGVNRPDLMQRQGKYPPPPGASDIPGLEIAGEVVAGGGDFREGQPVCALVSGGGYAEYCAVPAVQCLQIPNGLSPTEAAAIPETYFTVWTNLFDRGRLQPGERLLIHGGASGIGTTAIQLARARGVTVFATAGSKEKCEACVHLGATRAIDYRHEDFVEAVKLETGGEGVDVILDIIGGDYLQRNLSCLRLNGRLVQIGLMSEAKSIVDLRPVLQKRLTITASTLRARTPAEKGAIARAVEANVWPLIERGEVRPIVQATYPLARAADAHRQLESGRVIGKVVLRVD